jgi:hypothetical protein
MIFEESIESYRNQGADVTVDKILRHELQHIAMFRKGLPPVEPLMSIAQEYGVIDGEKTPIHFHFVKPHWMLPVIPWNQFYSHAKVEDYEIEWLKKEDL